MPPKIQASKPESLHSKQARFALMVADLILRAEKLRYQITFGEAYRTKEQAEINARKGIGIKSSLHCLRLAIDLNLFKDGVFLTKTEDYLILGEYWESLSPDNRWGGRFGDGNHFSLEHEGVK